MRLHMTPKHRTTRPTTGRRVAIVAATTLLTAAGLAPGASAASSGDDHDYKSDTSHTQQYDKKSWGHSSSDNGGGDTETDIDSEVDINGGDGGAGGDVTVECDDNDAVDATNALQDGLLGTSGLINQGGAEDGDNAPKNFCPNEGDGGEGADGGDGIAS